MTEDSAFEYRAKFLKVREARYLSHLDITRIMLRAIIRAGLDLKYSQGFSPKPKLSFSNPTPLGVDSFAEYSDMVLEKEVDCGDLLGSLNTQLPENLRMLEVKRIPKKTKSLMSAIDIICYEIVLIPRDEKDINTEHTYLESIRDGERFKDSIYDLKIEKKEPKKNVLLKLLGYAKILKAADNKVFKFNYFIDCLKETIEKEGLVLEGAYKKECYILKEKKLFTPIGVL